MALYLILTKSQSPYSGLQGLVDLVPPFGLYSPTRHHYFSESHPTTLPLPPHLPHMLAFLLFHKHPRHIPAPGHVSFLHPLLE